MTGRERLKGSIKELGEKTVLDLHLTLTGRERKREREELING